MQKYICGLYSKLQKNDLFRYSLTLTLTLTLTLKIKMRVITFIALSVLVCLFFSACRKGVERCAVEGVVTFQGKPVENANISIRPEAGPDAGAITDANGKYIIPMSNGPMPGNVQIMVEKFIKTKVKDANGNENEVFTPALPPEFQGKTKAFTLTSGKNKIDLNLDQ
jgi:hypothetical protein